MPIALPALGGLVEFALMLAAFIILWAFALFLMALTGVLRNVPLVGGWLQDNLVAGVSDAVGTARDWCLSQAGHAVGFFWTTITWTGSLFARIGQGMWAGVQATDRIVHGAIPRSIDTSKSYADQRYWDAVGHADTLYAQELAYAQGLEQQAEAHANDLYNRETVYVQDLYNASISHADQLQVIEQGYAQQLSQASVAYTQAQVAATDAWTQQLVGAAEANAQAATAGVIDWTQKEVGALGQEISGAYTAATTYAHDAAIAAAAPALALAETTALSLTRYLDECGKNLCTGLNPLSTALQALAPLLEGGLLFVLVAEAARNPAGVANEVNAVLSPIANEAASLFRDATGVAA
jgi:hypothetical protein